MAFLFADLILPLPLKERFTYAVPSGISGSIAAGMRVCVPFGPSKVYAGIVAELHDRRPGYATKEILSLLDDAPIVSPLQIRFWQWMAHYYLCSEGEVMACALPSGFQLDSETKIVVSPQFDGSLDHLTDVQQTVVKTLARQEQLTIRELERLTGLKKVLPLIKSLRSQNIIWVKAEISERYKPLQKAHIGWGDAYRDNPEAQQAIFDRLEKKAFKQLEVLLAYVALARNSADGLVQRAMLTRKTGTDAAGNEEGGTGGAATAALAALIRKGILQVTSRRQSRLDETEDGGLLLRNTLSEPQKKALADIKAALGQTSVCLLHGVTASGKTEVYMQLMEEILATGRQVLYLLPEIALTAQMIGRLKARFGEQVGVYHSKYNEHEKIEIWQATAAGRYRIILGARSALFLPFERLGLIVVDEEHETSYKQQDPAPRYHARDAAVYLAALHGAKVLLGSATPSIESYYNALKGKYGLATLFTRHADVRLPSVWVANLKANKSLFTPFLVEKMTQALADGKQIMLFQNRRGFSNHLVCTDCGAIPHCRFCDVSLTYHKKQGALVCHYCGYTVPVPDRCPECGSTRLNMAGAGTEKIEEELSLLFPEARTARMDMDSTRGKNAYERLIADFESRKIQILVGTQMITKGLDFDNVGVVGILNADNLIFFPDFRAYERSFQLMTQVSGRAGRRAGQEGEVVLQTYSPQHELIRHVMHHDYTALFESQLTERKRFLYPPYCRLVQVSVRHKEEAVLDAACRTLSDALRQTFGSRVLGPEYPMVSRISTYYIKNFLLKLERGRQLETMKETLALILERFSALPAYRSCRIIVDVDPY
ncbi:MAG: primosomal protein N' [Bacteroidales bacterium]|nr:primosomal protein N' [Bacteroidales bacterium]